MSASQQHNSTTALGFIPLGQDPQDMQQVTPTTRFGQEKGQKGLTYGLSVYVSCQEEEGGPVSEAELHERHILVRYKIWCLLDDPPQCVSSLMLC